MTGRVTTGAVYAAVAFLIWGLFPLYWVHLAEVPPLQLLAHRVVWCAVAVWLWLLVRGELGWVRRLPRRTFGVLCVGALLITVNWLVYVVAVTTGRVVDASLGYFITPLVNIILAVVVLGERLNVAQRAAVLLAAIGVTWLGWRLGAPPWVALTLAVTFACYGLVRKLAPCPAAHSLAVESGVLFLPALAWLLACELRGTGAFLHGGLAQDLLLVVGGPVTAIPLLLFAAGAQRVSMTLLGVLQYISPTVGLAVGVWVLHEPFGVARAAGFACIWVALAVFTLDGLRRYRRLSWMRVPPA